MSFDRFSEHGPVTGRVRSNYQAGRLSVDAGTTPQLSSDDFVGLPAVQPQLTPLNDPVPSLVLALDPDAENGTPELVYVTRHDNNTTVIECIRGRELTAARVHTMGTPWRVVFSAGDFFLLEDSMAEMYGVYAQVVENQGLFISDFVDWAIAHLTRTNMTWDDLHTGRDSVVWTWQILLDGYTIPPFFSGGTP